MLHNINTWTAAIKGKHTDTLTKSIMKAYILVAEHLMNTKLYYSYHILLDAYTETQASNDDSSNEDSAILCTVLFSTLTMLLCSL